MYVKFGSLILSDPPTIFYSGFLSIKNSTGTIST